MAQIAKNDIAYCEQCGVPLHINCANHCLVCGKTLCDTCYADNNYRCEECYKPDESFSVIRRSHLEQYAGCPYSLYLQLVKGITPPMGSHAQLGVIVHELIDKISHYPCTAEEIHAELERKIVDWNLSTDDEYSIITTELEATGHLCIDNFWMIKDSFSKDFVSEHNIKFSLDDDLPQVSCTLDRISFVGDDIVVNDWKTGKPMSGQKLITDLQPPLYLYSVYKEYGRMPKSFNLHYLKYNKTITYQQVDDMHYKVATSRKVYVLNVEEALERTKKILDGIQHHRFNMPDEKTHQWRCNSFCWFGISGKCAGSVKEQWKQLNEEYKAS